MFFGCDDMSVNILGAFELNWDSKGTGSYERPFHALSFRICGDAHLTSPDGTKNHLKTNDIAFFPANYTYTHRSQCEHLYVIHFNCDSIIERAIKKFTPEHPEAFARLFADIYSAWSKKQFGYMYECKAKLYKILLKMEKEWNEQNILSENDKILDAVDYIHDHFLDRTMTVEHLSFICGMSDTYFRKLFRAALGVTPLKYINRLRFKYAYDLLRSDYYTIEEISEKCGFNNVHYFSLFIKKQTGYPPSVYRLHVQNEDQGD